MLGQRVWEQMVVPGVLLVTTDLSGTRSQSCLRCHLLTSQPAEQTPQEVFLVHMLFCKVGPGMGRGR